METTSTDTIILALSAIQTGLGLMTIASWPQTRMPLAFSWVALLQLTLGLAVGGYL